MNEDMGIKPKRRAKRVPWAFKTWDEFTESDKQALEVHLAGMEKSKRKDYRNYLSNHCNVPKGE